MRQNWPERLWLVRHGQSQGNVARDAADEAGAHEIDIDLRDVDVPLVRPRHRAGRSRRAAGSPRLPRDERPEIILSSPYVRARQTAEIICEQGALAGGPARTIVDERLREREFGIFDRLTTVGIRERFPEEAAHRRRLGKFYHRPPGGESWADVILRLRSMLNTINLHYCDRRVLVVCHQVVVLCFRYILEELDEAADPRHRQAGRGAQLRHRRLRFRARRRRAVRARRSRCGTTARRSRRRARPRPRRRTRWRERGEARAARPRALDAHPLPPVVDGDKETKGRILVVAGSREVPGAALLTATAAMRAGAGKLQHRDRRKHRRRSSASRCPKRWWSALPEDGDGGFAAAAVGRDRRAGGARSMRSSPGPGMAQGEACAAHRRRAARDASARLALDAALLHCARAAARARTRRPTPILLPHAGELASLARLRRGSRSSATRSAAAARAAELYRSIVLVKGVDQPCRHAGRRRLDLRRRRAGPRRVGQRRRARRHRRRPARARRRAAQRLAVGGLAARRSRRARWRRRSARSASSPARSPTKSRRYCRAEALLAW